DTAMVNLSATMLNDISVEKYGKKFDELTVTQQEQLKIQEAIRQHTSAGVFEQGEREADSYENNVAMLKNTWKELLGEFGSPVIGWVGDRLKDLSGFLQKVDVDAIVEGFKRFGSYISDTFSPVVEGVKTVFEGVSSY